MPKSTTPVDEQHIFMYHILNGVNDKTINWNTVCKATNLNKGAAHMRWIRLKGKIEDALKGDDDTESADDITAESGNTEVKTEAEKAPGKTMPKMGVFKPRRSKNVNTAESEIAPPVKKRRTTKRKRADQTNEEDANKGASEATAEK
ncbi:uncharacterized protein CDV56_106340 [Aspergillus thermomutatus]|uniref:Myb-like DNA-binding domain-containing protein n=1 Tax=Aspergillus thermomutatus TaxID=41047 RepID=A0A397GMW6_ASPTH|nr:uncharacterized protein CDV56_106340 [Aspergillus thermomutatus]RHZ52381.1 hypothetical protein CDV56_106340 [Aspergillus thermomutatus]